METGSDLTAESPDLPKVLLLINRPSECPRIELACDVFHRFVDKAPPHPLESMSSVFNIAISWTVVGLDIFKAVFSRFFFLIGGWWWYM